MGLMHVELKHLTKNEQKTGEGLVEVFYVSCIIWEARKALIYIQL